MKKRSFIPIVFSCICLLMGMACANDSAEKQASASSQQNTESTTQQADNPPPEQPNGSTSQQVNKSTNLPTLTHNNLTWLTENMNVATDSSWCYNDTPSYCDRYGRLYSIKAAQKACASLGKGWRLPSMEEWKELILPYGEMGISPVGSTPSAFEALLKGGKSGFNAVRGGSRLLNEMYADIGDQAYYWTTMDSPEYPGTAYRVILFQSSYGMVTEVNFDPGQGASCRCVKE